MVECIDSLAVAELRAEALSARANGNTPASEAGTSDADRGDTETTNSDPSVAGGPDGIAGPVNGRDADPEPTPPAGPPSPRSSTISAGRRPRRIGRPHLAGGWPIARLAAAHLRPPPATAPASSPGARPRSWNRSAPSKRPFVPPRSGAAAGRPDRALPRTSEVRCGSGRTRPIVGQATPKGLETKPDTLEWPCSPSYDRHSPAGPYGRLAGHGSSR